MLTVEEIDAIPLLSGLKAPERERLAKSAADLQVAAGEYAVNEGEERALFVVLEGVIEVVKRVDGIDRVIGKRLSGQIFGEVPITLGTPFPGGFRAAAPSRVMRIDAQQYHAIAAGAPDVALKVGALARERIGGLRDIAAEPPKPRLTVVGQRFDPRCSELRGFLAKNQISFEWISPDVADFPPSWKGARPSVEDCPAVQLADGTTLVRPEARKLAQLLGLATSPSAAEYDVIIVGGGPAGLAAAVYGASEGLRTIVIEREAPGGQAGTSSRIENYLGFPSGISGDELSNRALQQARRLGAEILVTRSITRIDVGARCAFLDGEDMLHSRTIILATGVSWRHLDVPGFERLIGKGVFYGASRSEASGAHGLDIHLVGAGNSAGQAALLFANHARTVTVLCRGDALEKSMSQYLIEQLRRRSNIRVETGCEVAGVLGEGALKEIDVRHVQTGEVERRASGGLFIFIGADAETSWLPPEIALDARGYVLTGTDVRSAGRWPANRDPFLLETSVPGVFACGDVRSSPIKRVASAVGEGSMAIAFIHQFLKQER